MIHVNAIGDACPIPVVKTKNAIKELQGSGQVEVWVDNEIAVQNLAKMAKQKGYGIEARKLEEQKYSVLFTIEKADGTVNQEQADSQEQKAQVEAETVCTPDSRSRDSLVVISSDRMGEGNEELGHTLMKGFLYALTQQDELPACILFYNGGARLTCEGSASLEDLRMMESQGVEILTCGTCLNFYGLSDKLQVGGVTNMYVIAEKMTQAGRIIKP
ncbi:MAG: sulfurtransferase-like selenium metabolism protein YedF [Lachnospiraceae bacterium]|nr:sulfurtransferase-like selenium metabolism protein YedF [Lachnospiraceae bacterium]